jgi:hypothetical protein
VTLAIHLHLVPRLRMSGTILLFPSVSSWRAQGHLYFYFKKGKVHPITDHEGPEVKRYSSTLFLTSGLYEGGWSTPRPGRFAPGKDPVPTAQEPGWAPGPVWRGAENLTPTMLRSPDRPAGSKSLCRLSYTGPCPIM